MKQNRKTVGSSALKAILAIGGAMAAAAGTQKLCRLLDNRKLKGAYGWRIEVQGRKMCVKVSGSGKETVVLLPGAGEASPALVYQPLAEALGKRYTTVTIEYFGYGLSDPAPSQRTAENMAEELHELLRKLGLERYILMAHSYSGIVSLEYLSRYPEEVSAFVGLDITVPKLLDYVNAGKVNLRFLRAYQCLNKLGVLRLVSRFRPSAVMAPIAPERYSPEELELYRRLCLSAGNQEDMLQELRLSESSMERLREAKLPPSVPALQFISLDSGTMLEKLGAKPETWYELHRELSEVPESEVTVLAGGHYLQCEYPEEIAEEFHNWYSGFQK